MSSPDGEHQSKEELPKTVNDKNSLKLKFVALRNGLIEEKNKNKQIILENENLQKEIEELKKLNTELNTKNEKLDEENQKIKEENVTKQELINKLKEELQKYQNKSTKKLSNFFSSLLESDSAQNFDLEEKDKNNLKIESLEQENFKLNKDLAELKSKYDFTNSKLTEALNDYNTLNNNSKKNLDEIEFKYKKKLDELNQDKINSENNFKKKLDENEKKLLECLNTIRDKEIIIKSIESIKGDRDKDIITMKEKVRLAEETLNNNNEKLKLIVNKNISLEKELTNKKKDVEDLQMQIQQYKLIIEEVTPFSIDYIFKGKIIHENKKIEMCFGKYQQSLYIKIDEKEFILVPKEIQDIIANKYIPGQIKIVLKLNGKKTQSEILAQFTKKEGEYIRKFFREFKNKSSNKEDELMNLSLNNYFY